MNYMSVFSGIEAATVAWHPLGWTPVAFAENEKFPCAVLAHHYPSIPNLGDVTRFKEWPDAAIDVLVGGSPCQSFSVAGLRQGLADPRGNLALTYLGIVDRYHPEWVVWENVPGVLSVDGGRAFGSFLGGLAQLGYGFAYRVIDAQYVRVDRFGRAVPQRRRRVFVVGNSRNWRRAAAVLFEPESLSRNSAPRRETRQSVTGATAARLAVSGGARTVAADVAPGTLAGGNRTGGVRPPGTDGDTTGSLIVISDTAFNNTGQGWWNESDVASGLRDASAGGASHATVVAQAYVPDIVSQAMSSKWSKGSSGPAGDEVANLVAHTVAFTQNQREEVKELAPAPARGWPGHRRRSIFTPRAAVVAYGIRSDASRNGEAKTPSPDAEGRVRLRNPGMGVYSEVAPTVDASQPHTVAYGIQERAVCENPDAGPDGMGVRDDGASYTLEARSVPQAVAFQANGIITQTWVVRRLTPTECERLQGFKDGYTNIPWRGKNGAPDGPRYKALGNSMAVNCMRWLGWRIAMVDALTE